MEKNARRKEIKENERSREGEGEGSERENRDTSVE
jgi:hypothetical protein